MKNKLQSLYEKRDELNRQRHQLLDEIKELEYLLVVEELDILLSGHLPQREYQYRSYWFVRKNRNKYPELVKQLQDLGASQ